MDRCRCCARSPASQAPAGLGFRVRSGLVGVRVGRAQRSTHCLDDQLQRVEGNFFDSWHACSDDGNLDQTSIADTGVGAFLIDLQSQHLSHENSCSQRQATSCRVEMGIRARHACTETLYRRLCVACRNARRQPVSGNRRLRRFLGLVTRLLGFWGSMGLGGGALGAFLPQSGARKENTCGPLSAGPGGGEEEEEFFNHYKNDLTRHRTYPVG